MEVFIKVTEQKICGNTILLVGTRIVDHSKLTCYVTPIKTRFRVNACLMAIENAVSQIIQTEPMSFVRNVTIVVSEWKAIGYIYGNSDCTQEKPLSIGKSIMEKIVHRDFEFNFQPFYARNLVGQFNSEDVENISSIMEEDAVMLSIQLQHVFRKKHRRNDLPERASHSYDRGNEIDYNSNQEFEEEWD